MSEWGEDAAAEARPIGDLIDGLGIEAHVGDDELVAGAIVLLKVVEVDGSTRLSVSHSDGLGWIERSGMLRIAEQAESGPARHEQVPDEG
ncbi:hypothetical protein [Streptomyces pacificus]|uniref:Uncharacterized protein n=1 Tax=Streptomyces pacificus TaxID=2705029 RepID=A0A6A0APT0_9ACTN|nr:hypothetical protein [Streptomyces pacificus]GFH34303.1 hypothetical protein SCWH03_05170 [Streptomyces pacificus]